MADEFERFDEFDELRAAEKRMAAWAGKNMYGGKLRRDRNIHGLRAFNPPARQPKGDDDVAFEIFRRASGVRSVPPGTARMNSTGGTSFSPQDLTMVGITDQAVILIDRELKRVAIRAPARSAMQEPVTPCRINKARTSGKVNLGAAIRRMELDPATFAGQYPLVIADSMLQIQLKATPALGPAPLAGKKLVDAKQGRCGKH